LSLAEVLYPVAGVKGPPPTDVAEGDLARFCDARFAGAF
jgi:hypothetical protein